MKKPYTGTFRRAASGRIEQVQLGTRLDVSLRATKTVAGSAVIVRIAMTKREIIQSTAKQLKDLVGSPITEGQRDKAAQLATKAMAAKKSSVTAKFLRVAA